jgi:hypothetical protein
VTSYDILVDPQRLLRIRFLDAAREDQNLVALTCGYVPVRSSDGTARVAVEIVIDPAMQNPGVPYYCDPQGLRHYYLVSEVLTGCFLHGAPGDRAHARWRRGSGLAARLLTTVSR